MAVAAALVLAGTVSAGAATTDPGPSALELQNAQRSKAAATQGMVLLENQNKALPMPKTGNVALFGVGAHKTVAGGTGSGEVNNRYTVSIRKGLENAGYPITTSDAYYQAMVAAYDAKYPSGSGGFGKPAIDYSSVEQLLTPATVAPTAPTDTAIYVVARNSGEGADRTSGPGDYLLTDVERADLKLIGQTYKNTVVVLNVGGVVDTSFFKQINAAATDPAGHDALDSLLLMSQAGQESGNALTEILNGTVTPSGKLTDTWASSYAQYPAAATFASNDGDPLHEQYSEGIYVGYRYFDSKYRSINAADPAGVVNYPFGYGLSYAHFRIDAQTVTADMKAVTVKAKVTNTGRAATGKQVVQAYFSAPQTGLDKPYQELAGYAKTAALAPGASQTVTIRFDTTQMSSYDVAKAAYVMDAGDYLIRVGTSSRDTHVAARLNLKKTTVTQQLSNQQNDTAPATELTSSPSEFYGYASQHAEIAKARLVNLSTKGFRAEQNTSKYDQSVAVDPSSPYSAIDGAKISSTTAYLDRNSTDWEGTGAPYVTKTGETAKYVRTKAGTTLYDVLKKKATIEQFVAGLSTTQLATIVEGSKAAGSTKSADGAAGYTTAKYESAGLPAMTLSDGPAGLRLTKQLATTPATYQFATAWPIGTLLAQSWDPGVVTQVGAAIGAEMKEFGVTLWLAPGMNIHRDPLNGRNFEYYAEDPLVAGLTSAAATKGVQSNPGVGVTIKHFVANNQETDRNTTDAVIGERALREIYLKGFEIAVTSAQPMAVMTSYNKVNGRHTAGSYDLDTNILRGEWGFKGLTMTDWTSVDQAGILAVQYAGNDLVEPGNNPGQVVASLKKVVPTLDLTGLPAYNKSTTTFGELKWTTYVWSLGSLTLSADGDQTIRTTVDKGTDLSQVPLSGETSRDAINNEVFTPVPAYGSVANAYAALTGLLAPASTALNATQKAAISIGDVVHQDPSDATSPVVSYTVVIKGSYPATGYNLRLGDLQRSATNILKVAMQTSGFGELATANGVDGVKIRPYTAQFRNLSEYMTSSTGQVVTPRGKS
ncbi:glycoside hydrolase family 3 protein [Pengzhenrongella sp.]|jgi:beta-glucosidase|uniref:glycoside hydrolase family 3 protein n=1 Tax=Pengzhenrongella sp. TaxID=2888820 RepID=UPI002F94C6EC